jgi:hypothetical protein
VDFAVADFVAEDLEVDFVAEDFAVADLEVGWEVVDQVELPLEELELIE